MSTTMTKALRGSKKNKKSDAPETAPEATAPEATAPAAKPSEGPAPEAAAKAESKYSVAKARRAAKAKEGRERLVVILERVRGCDELVGEELARAFFVAAARAAGGGAGLQKKQADDALSVTPGSFAGVLDGYSAHRAYWTWREQIHVLDAARCRETAAKEPAGKSGKTDEEKRVARVAKLERELAKLKGGSGS